MHGWLIGNAHVILWTAGCCCGVLAAMAVLRIRGALEWRTIVALAWAWFGLMAGGIWQARLEWMSFSDAVLFAPADVLRGGGRIPLGLATGAVLAAVWCLASGASWRATGDALAFAAPVIIAIGRFGCLAAGCCSGSVCGRWAIQSLCTHNGRGTEEFARQFAQGLISASHPAALPTHPLPVYFMAAAILLLALLLWQLRRDFAPGTLLVTFGFLWPLSKLGLEQFREVPRPPGLMNGVSIAMILASTAIFVVLRQRPRSPTCRAVTPAGRPDPG